MFIKLTFITNTSVYIGINNIRGFFKDDKDTIVDLVGQKEGEVYAVQETPEKIQELIDEQLLKMAKLSKST